MMFILISGVPDGPAKDAGILAGDVILDRQLVPQSQFLLLNGRFGRFLLEALIAPIKRKYSAAQRAISLLQAVK